jgi:myo-inositol-1(or 4)-monophosphatase
MLNTAIKAARRAATVINRASFDIDRIVVSEKQHNDFVTDVDQAAEQAIVETLLKAYPTHAILAEESGASGNLNDESEFVWIIDPIDGTTNFLHGYPNYCISIALKQRGVITNGLVYDPVRNDLFTALLVTEAGGIVGEFNGESDYLDKGDVIAAGPKVFGALVPLLSPFA